MRMIHGEFELSASDLANHLACRHLTALDLAVAKGTINLPAWRDPMLAVLQERGLLFEEKYLSTLRNQGLHISEPGADETASSFERTVTAMREGFDIIYQAVLKKGQWVGRADFLTRVDQPSNLGAWSYEVIDSKLARETRAGTILQICLYSQMIGAIQGVMPEYMHVITPQDGFATNKFRVQDFLAYHRLMQRRLENMISRAVNVETYPEPVPHCDICRWWQRCDRQRRADDHLSLVAGISKMQRNEIKSWGVDTLKGLAQVPLPLEHRPARGSSETYERVREQARVQLEARVTQEPVYELLPIINGKGFCSLPASSAGDIFFDMESDPFVGISGLEYLLGWAWGAADHPEYDRHWAVNPTAEKKAFETFIDLVMDRWQHFPDLHIYHFTAYEPSALKRLMGRYATRENELDRMLRAELFVDLHCVAKQALRAGIERYSLKELEIFHGFERALSLQEARIHLRTFERITELDHQGSMSEATFAAIEAYNRDDCISTMQLRNWLESLRANLVNTGQSLIRPAIQSGAPSEAVQDQQHLIQELYNKLAGNISPDPKERNEEQQAYWLLANMLDWHRRENKAVWWEYFRLRDLEKDELLNEKAALARLKFLEHIGTIKKSVIDRYGFPAQECEVRERDSLRDENGDPFGEVEAIDTIKCTIDIKKGPKIANHHPVSVFKYGIVQDQVKSKALLQLATWVAENGIDSPGSFRAGRDLLLGSPPRPIHEYASDDDPQKVALDWGLLLDQAILPIQGPPGAGKSHTAAHMIVAFVRAGKKLE